MRREGLAWLGRVALVFCTAVAFVLPATAQEQDPLVEEPEEEGQEEEEKSRDTVAAREGPEEIIVTGRRREELLSQTPISIRAFTSDELEARGIARLDEIGLSTANLLFASTIGSNSSARIYIRGVGQNDPRNIKDPGVGIYIDDVYLPRADGGLLSMVDICWSSGSRSTTTVGSTRRWRCGSRTCSTRATPRTRSISGPASGRTSISSGGRGPSAWTSSSASEGAEALLFELS